LDGDGDALLLADALDEGCVFVMLAQPAMPSNAAATAKMASFTDLPPLALPRGLPASH
jgi:hypothetical protein